MAKVKKLRGDKYWYTDFTRQGVRHHLNTYQTDKQYALRWMWDKMKEFEGAREPVSGQSISWPVFKAKYYEYSKASKDPQTHYRDRHAFEMIEKVFTPTFLSQITPELLERLKARWPELQHNRPAINRALSAIKAAMRKAEEWKYRTPEAWNKVAMLKTPEARLIFWSLEELAALKAVCRGYWLGRFMLGWEAGLRPSEKAKLEVKDVHWQSAKLHIRNAKGGKSRWVPLNERLASFLRSYPMGGRFVLRDDQPNDEVASAYFRKLVKKVPLVGSEYTLRHSFASHLAMAGVPMKKLAEMLGHASVVVTERHYAHLSPESLDSEMDKLPELCSSRVRAGLQSLPIQAK